MKRKSKSNIYFVDKAIKQVWPYVESIRINVTLSYSHAFFKTEPKTRTYTYNPDNSAYFHIPCQNEDCTGNGFNLYFKVSDMAAHRETYNKDTCQCEGNEARDHANSCPCVMEYEITIAYKSE